MSFQTPDRTYQRTDSKPWVTLLNDRFGLPPGLFAPYDFYQVGKKYIYLLGKNMQIDPTYRIRGGGLPLIKANLTYPKLTTAGALLLGTQAKKNTAHLPATQVPNYLHQQTLLLANDQLTAATMGYVIVQYDGIPLGTGLLFFQGKEAFLRSLFPKQWAGITLSSAEVPIPTGTRR